MTHKLPDRYAPIDMLRTEVATADQISVQLLRRNVQSHLQNALIYAQRSDELDTAANAVMHDVLAFTHVQGEHLIGDRTALEASKARALESIDRLAEILMNTPPNARANALGI